MYALLSLVVCLAGQPAVCETVTPDLVHPDTGQPPTLFECLGVGGQHIARSWLDEPSWPILQKSIPQLSTHPRVRRG